MVTSERLLRVDSKPRILMYSHDSYGLGHVRRTLSLAQAFVEHNPGLGVLILTGDAGDLS
jgi:predicted glycosyltransferase